MTDKPGTVRIISGKWRGKKLPIVGKQIRPTPDRVRETIFNWLMSSIASSRCLDLFAGTGVLGLEALSRGARWVTFVERDTLSAQALMRVCQSMQASDCQIISQDALRFVTTPPSEPFDIIFLDPPYASDLLEKCLVQLAYDGKHAAWSHPQTKIMIEYPKGKVISLPPNWKAIREQQAGEVCYALLSYQSDTEGT